MCRAVPPRVAHCSTDRPEIVGGVADENGKVMSQTRVSLGAAHSRDKLRSAQPPTALRTDCAEYGDWAAIDGDHDLLPGLYASEHPSRIVAQLPRRDLRHAT